MSLVIPLFPNFKKLEFEDKSDIEKFYGKSTISSDYHFASLWAWDLNEDIEISILNSNLVVKFKDYQTSKNLYSFLGSNLIENTIDSIFNFLAKNKQVAEINLLPENNFKNVSLEDLSAKYIITEDRDNFDYIFSVDRLLTYEGKNLYTKKKQLKKFLDKYLEHTDIVIMETINPETEKDMLLLLKKWSNGKLKKSNINDIEIGALKKTLYIIPKIKFFFFCIYISNKLAGFSLYEIIDKNHAIHSFQKADLAYTGITEFINQKIAEHLKSLGVSYINSEQDLGIEGLRRAKNAYNPIFLKKYTIRQKSAD